MNQDLYFSHRFENSSNHRYYKIILAQDLFGEWIVTKSWGGINKAGGRVIHVPCCSYQSALELINKLIKLRIKRGYTKVCH